MKTISSKVIEIHLLELLTLASTDNELPNFENNLRSNIISKKKNNGKNHNKNWHFILDTDAI